MTSSTARVPVAKTYKIFIDGKFPRTESGRYFPLTDANENVIANICRGSRKDFRNSVVAARKAFPGWASASAYLRGQILYRIAEMLEGRQEQFVAELISQGSSKRAANKEVLASIEQDVLVVGVDTDLLFPLREQEELVRHIPGAELEIIPGTFIQDPAGLLQCGNCTSCGGHLR